MDNEGREVPTCVPDLEKVAYLVAVIPSQTISTGKYPSKTTPSLTPDL